VKFKLGEFFCGPGGIALGAIHSGSVKNTEGETFSIAPSWATDYDYETCETYSRNIHHEELATNEHVRCEDVRKLDIKKLDTCDGFAFGFPCNDFSIVGESKGLNGHFGPLYTYGVEYLRQHKPLWFVAENVSGLSSSNEGIAFKKILSALIDTGYRVTPHLYRFEEYGVPQARHRIIIVGIRNDLPYQFKVPAPLEGRAKSSFQALCEPAIPLDAHNHELTKQSKQVVERLKHIAPGENAWSDSIPEHLKLNVKGARLSNIYKRLHPDKPAYTVTGSGGGGTHMYHWDEHRALTNRERARLQTFPDNYIFFGKKESVRKQIGMAVPPDGIKIIFKAILDTFAGNEYKSISSNIEFNQ
jgi:DNA (cytosine-5)-methyltransferase 1